MSASALEKSLQSALDAARKNNESSQSQLETSQQEVEVAEKCLKEAEMRWEVIDVDSVVINEQEQEDGSKRRKLSSDDADAAPIMSENNNEINSPLTPNAVFQMHGMGGSLVKPSFQPILQIIHLKKIVQARGSDERWKVCSPILNTYVHAISPCSMFTQLCSRALFTLGCPFRSQCAQAKCCSQNTIPSFILAPLP